MDSQERIIFEPGKRGGQPCIRGMRISVGDVLEMVEAGMTEREILADFPELEREDIRACLAYSRSDAEWDRRFAKHPEVLDSLAEEALREREAGETTPLEKGWPGNMRNNDQEE